jgi:hypothetical protein
MNTRTSDAVDVPVTGQMARFTLQNGMTLEIHIPGATSVTTADSPTEKPGFILRDGDEIENVGVLPDLLPAPR